MASTKIIHVLKDDNPEDILELFRSTDANEVIFIFPKSSKFSKEEQYFEFIKKEADISNKRVSIMTNDPLISRFASTNDLEVLEKSSGTKYKTKPSKQIKQDEDESTNKRGYEEVDLNQGDPEEVSDLNEQEESDRITATGVGAPVGLSRVIKDIFRNESDQSVLIKWQKVKTFPVQIKTTTKT